MKMKATALNTLSAVLASVFLSAASTAQPATIRVDARQPGRETTRHPAGVCIEDVNHEIYGGIYSQMLFGESFQEPPRTAPVKGFVACEGRWRAANGEVDGDAGPGHKLIDTTLPAIGDGEVGADVLLPGGTAGNAGLILRVNRAGAGADQFDGYEVSIDVARKRLVLGRHRHDFRLLAESPCDVAPDRWIALSVQLSGGTIECLVDGKSVLQFPDERPLPAGAIGLRQWQRPARYRKLWAKTDGRRVEVPFESSPTAAVEVSGMWGPARTGDAALAAAVERDGAFIGAQSQRITFTGGTGAAGVENRGLNRQGLGIVAGKPYDGYLWLKADKPTDVLVSLESGDGSRSYAETRLAVTGNQWQRYEFQLTPDAGDIAARFAVKLKAPGSVVLGHAFLQPGDWGRFKGLPVRRDVVEALIDQGVTLLRYGGSMVNAPEYRWKKMIGPRDRRPPYKGNWYPYSTNGWGVVDFLDLCEAAGFVGIPDLSVDESPQDLADFVEYVNGSADTEWGGRRAADGHPAPYKLKHLEIGNEERVDDRYYEKFAAIARAVWAKDPEITLVVGDFAYNQPITDPMNVRGADSRITSLAAHEKILRLARDAGREVWFDVHVWTDGPDPSPSLKALPSYIDALEKLADGARHKVVVFELNANNHTQRRALANAQAIGTILRDARIPVICSANALQVDGQNDNGWDQGLLFLNPSKVWLQPPGFVTQMTARNRQPRVLEAELTGATAKLDITATRSEDGKSITLSVVNLNPQPQSATLQLDGFTPAKPAARVEELAGPLGDRNTAEKPEQIKPRQFEWKHGLPQAGTTYAFPPHSFTIIRFE
jgi:hypothetical protein